MTVFQKEEVVKTNELERDIAGLIQKDTKKKFYKDRSAKIEFYSLQLRDDKISVKRFLKIMANVDNKIIFEESDFSVLDVDEIEFSSSEDKDLYTDIVKKVNGNTPAMKSKDDTSATPTQTPTPTLTPKPSTSTKPLSSPTILTRSKSRKVLRMNALVANNKEISSPLRRTRKRCVVDSNVAENENSSSGRCNKRAKVGQI